MDALDRTYHHLVRTIRAKFPQYVSQPFDVAELCQTILPYRHHRRDLALDTNEDYEITLTELLSGARDYLIVDDRMRDTLRAELATPNPDPSAFKQFSEASVALSPASLRKLDGVLPERPSRVPAKLAPAEPTPPRRSGPFGGTIEFDAPATAPSMQASSADDDPPVVAALSNTPSTLSSPVLPMTATTPREGERCRACDQALPAGRAITFCPHCGQNLTTTNCVACGSELELTWKYCPVCGRPAAGAK